VDHTRIGIERDQLARTLMRRIGDDLRAAVRREPFDDAGLKSLLGAAKNAASALAGGSGAGSGSGENPSGSPGTRGTGTTGRTGTTGTTSPAGTTQSTSGGDNAAPSDDTAAAGAPASIAGLYGTASELQIDIARVPRPDEFAEAMITGGVVPADIKTVYYFLAQASAGVTTSDTGLMRSEMNRATALFASENGDFEIFTQNAEPLAAEVVGLQFRYFDGFEWFPEWSSQERNGLPLAIEIALVIADPQSADEPIVAGTFIDPTVDEVDPELVYHTVVHLPNGQISEAPADTGDMGDTSDSSTGQGTSSGQGTSGSGTSSSGAGSGGTKQ
jgi:hypothetical protein